MIMRLAGVDRNVNGTTPPGLPPSGPDVLALMRFDYGADALPSALADSGDQLRVPSFAGR